MSEDWGGSGTWSGVLNCVNGAFDLNEYNDLGEAFPAFSLAE
jgi:hypothetical protein